MDQIDLLTRLSVALAIGLLVGLERGWKTREAEEHVRAAGFRTFALSGLMGGVCGALALAGGGLVIGLGFLGFALAFTVFHALEARAERQFSATTVIAGLLTFLLGALAVQGDLGVAVAAGVAMTIVLALREQLHRWVASLSWVELRATLTLLAMTFLLLPVLPDRTIDPWDTVNPHQVWLLAILMAAISFGGYIAVRVWGEDLGVVVAALAGGLASSTATTLTLARIGREHAGSERLLAAGVLLAGAVSVTRVGAIALVLEASLLRPLAPALAAGALTLAAGAAILLLGNRRRERPELTIANPLQVGTALQLSAVIVAVMLAARIVRDVWGDVGVLAVGALSGIADVDAVTLTMAKLAGRDLSATMAAQAILAAVAVNTLTKTALAGVAGGGRLGLLVGVASAAAVAAGGAAALLAG